MSGFNRKDIENNTGMHISAYALEGVSVNDRFAMINHFFHMYPNGLKTLVYEVNPVLFSNKKTSENTYTLFYPYMDDSSINEYIFENANIREYFINKIIRTKRFDPHTNRLIMMGYLNKFENLKNNTLDSSRILQMIHKKDQVEITLEQYNIEIFEKTMHLILSHNASIILVMMPMHISKLETFKKESYENLCNYLEHYSSLSDNIKFLDLNQDSLIFNPHYFSDPLHFNVYGQRKITELISSYLVEN
ncbi:MAG: hypothetical protein K9H49_19795 [Bacteroidales bacterium]|nr:hypothetical protein [Bacteroidales bacterium]MCF8392053.1 hypothetical protein [Bacteroidales bacterium]